LTGSNTLPGSPSKFSAASNRIRTTIYGLGDLHKALLATHGARTDSRGDSGPHTLFELHPKDDERLYDSAITRIVSDWALDTLLQHQHNERGHSAYQLYTTIKSNPDFAEVAGRIWERAFHRFIIGADKAKLVFTLRKLEADGARGSTKKISLNHHALQSHLCGPDREFEQWLHCSVSECFKLYLYPNSPTFPGVDSVMYLPGQPLILFQATRSDQHTIKTKVLDRVNDWITQPDRSELLPRVDRPWDIVFVVPAPVGASYRRCQRLIQPREPVHQNHTATAWSQRTQRYVLELDEAEVFASFGGVAFPEDRTDSMLRTIETG
jgi:hypothetical protein